MSGSDESPPGIDILSGEKPSSRAKQRPSFRPPRKADAGFKKKLLRGAFEENVDLIKNQPLGTTRRKREQKWKRLKKWILGSGGVLVLVLALSLLTGGAQNSPAGQHKPRIHPPLTRVGSDQPETLSIRAATLAPDTLGLGVHRIVIDPGHGGIDGGTSIKFGMKEKDITLDIGLRLAEILQKRGFDIVMTRRDDVAISLADRAEKANSAHADLFISIHVNWLPKRSARGFETYYSGASDDPFLNALARKENSNSGFTLNDTRKLLDAIYSGTRRKASRTLARRIQASLYSVLKQENPGVISRGVMQAPFVVLVATEMPAVLAEVACLSNDREARLLAIPSYRRKVAEGLAQGIMSFARSTTQLNKGEPE